MAGGAEAAVAADGQERADDVVARLDARDARADLLDDAGALVAADDREARHDVAVAEVLVGVAQPGGHPADQHLALLGLVELELDDLPVAARSPTAPLPWSSRGLLLRVTPTARSYPVVDSGALHRAAGALASALAAEALARPAYGACGEPSRSRIAECQISSAGGSTSWYWSSCLHARVAARDLERRGQPRGDGPSASARGRPRSGSRTRSGRGPAGAWSASRSALRLASLSSALVSRESAPIGTSSGRPAAMCGRARELVRVDREAVGLQRRAALGGLVVGLRAGDVAQELQRRDRAAAAVRGELAEQDLGLRVDRLDRLVARRVERAVEARARSWPGAARCSSSARSRSSSGRRGP